MLGEEALMGRIGVALSGGGHRATVWALGTLLYLTDAGQHRRVGTITSVSGGSIANGVIARHVDYTQADGAALRAAITPLLHHIAHEGLFFFGPATNAYVYTVLGLAGLTVAALLATVVVSNAAGGGAVVVAGLMTLGLAGATIMLFSKRSLVTDRALARVHFGDTKLADVARTVEHIFCATELQAGNHVYFAPRFVYNYRAGIGTPGDLALSTAVQSSACLPGAFPPRRLPTGRHRFVPVPGVDEPARTPPYLVVNDGGVYDNMGDEWFAGYGERLAGWPDLASRCPPADELIVVNGSGGWGWQPIERWSILRAELVGVLGSKDVLYNSSTRIRRRDLIETFRAHEKNRHGYVGALVHIPQSPFTTADGFSSHGDERGGRAKAVLATLGDDPDIRARWKETARRNTGVKTVLRKLGPDDTVRLLRHSYVLAMCNLHVVLGYPLLDIPSDDAFAALVAE
jgi:hypothetical protein